MRRTFFLFFFSALTFPFLSSALFGSLVAEETADLQTPSPLRVTVLGRAICQSLEKRVLMMVKIEDESGHTHIKPFYRSSGLNSGSMSTHFPFENLSGRFGEKKFTQFYVEKVHVDPGEYALLRQLVVGAGSAIAPRFGSLLYACVSAVLGGGFWDTPDGIESKSNMGVIGCVPVQGGGECLALQTSAEIRNWMRSFHYQIKSGPVFEHQQAYARFSYEVLRTLAHRLDGDVKRSDLGENYRQLCLRVKDKVRPEALALLVPGFQENYSLHDYSRYVDENIVIEEWRKHNVAFLPISINFYQRGLVSEAIYADMAVLRQMKFVKENKLPYIPSEPMDKMNLIIDQFLGGERFVGALQRTTLKELKKVSRANTFCGVQIWEKLQDLQKQPCPGTLERSAACSWMRRDSVKSKILQELKQGSLKRTVAFDDLSLYFTFLRGYPSSNHAK